MTRDEQTRRLVVAAIALTSLVATLVAGVLGWRAIDTLATNEPAAAAAVAIVGSFTTIAAAGGAALAGVLNLRRDD